MRTVKLIVKKSDEVPFNFDEVKSLCDSCAHLDRSSYTHCKAFPAGIPLGILTGAFEHNAPYSVEGVDDGGTLYEPVDAA